MNPHILSSGVVIVKPSPDEGFSYLLLCCYDYWDFPKGMVEVNESPLEAAIREVREETALTSLDFKWGYEYCETGPYKRGSKIARYYLAQTDEKEVELPINPELGHAEHSEYRWVTYDTAMNMLSPRVKKVIRWARGKLDPAEAQNN